MTDFEKKLLDKLNLIFYTLCFLAGVFLAK